MRLQSIDMKINSLATLLEEELKDVYSAEKQLIRAMPKMAKKASSPELKRALEQHLEVTKRQAERLERVFEELGKSAKAKTCRAMKGIIEEANEMMGENADASVMDAAIIACAQKVEHYEIATYGTLKSWAQRTGQSRAASLLDQTLQEEGEADKRLTGIAEGMVNAEAERGGGDDDESSSGGGGLISTLLGGGKKSSKKGSGSSKKSSTRRSR